MGASLGGSWVVISGSLKWVISPLIWVISIVTPLMTPLITTHEPPSGFLGFQDLGSSWGLRVEGLG